MSRVPPGCKIDLSSVKEIINDTVGDETLEDLIKSLLQYYKRKEKWRLNIVDVFKAEFLLPEYRNAAGQTSDPNKLPLNVDKVVDTLVRLFQSGMLHSRREAEVHTFTHVLQCWKHDYLAKQPDFYRNVYVFWSPHSKRCPLSLIFVLIPSLAIHKFAG